MKSAALITVVMLASAISICAQESSADPVDAKPGHTLLQDNKPAASPTSWRNRYELGPGDVVNFSLFGRPELDRPGFRIAPDGTISFLQAQNIKVSGLTLDEARRAIETGLTPHFRSPRVIITPGEVASKRFTILGKVTRRGIITLERPMTLIEAVAIAGGLETGLFDYRIIELADLDRSFISRNGQRLPVDFRRLFHEGDMKHNLEIEPDDFIFVASNISNDYYVLGAVASPGIQGLTEDASVVAGITRRGGFTERAWTERILVIRGSSIKPETFVINVKDVLAAKTSDFKILPKDILYVADRPWAEAEDILKQALSAFATSATSSWINLNTDINSP